MTISNIFFNPHMQILSDYDAMDPEHLPKGQIPQAIRRKGYKHISCAKVHLRSTTKVNI